MYSPVRLTGNGPDWGRGYFHSPKTIMGKFNARRIIGGLMLMAGGLCGLYGGSMLFVGGVRKTAGDSAPEGTPWGSILPLVGAAAVLIVVGKMIAGPQPPKKDGKAD